MSTDRRPPPPPLTPREAALGLYFHAVATDPALRVAGRDPAAFGLAFLKCFLRDAPAVVALALGRKLDEVEIPFRAALKRASVEVLSGDVPPGVARHIAEVVDEEIVARGAQWLREKLAPKK